MTIQEALKKVTSGENLTTEECSDVFGDIMSGKATDAQIAGFLVALRMKGETIEEITGAAEVMREKATPVIPQKAVHMVDTCGTGGDGSNTFNISTAAAFVAAGAGATVAKHGNRSVSSRSGSADVLEALGINISVTPEKMKECLDSAGICYLFAPSLHKAMKYASGPRREMGIRTLFNILGPLTNPSRSPNQLLGVFSPELTEIMARVLQNMGCNHVYTVHGMNRLDEISISDETQISELSGGKVETFRIKPEDFGIERSPAGSVIGGTAEENASIILSIFKGGKGPCRDVAVLNAGFAIAASGLAENPEEGIKMACESIDSGAAIDKVNRLKELTNQ